MCQYMYQYMYMYMYWYMQFYIIPGKLDMHRFANNAILLGHISGGLEVSAMPISNDDD